MSTLTLNRRGLADRLNDCFTAHGAPPVTLLQFEVDRSVRPVGQRRSSDGDGSQQLAMAAALRSRVRDGDVVACVDDGAVVVGCVGAAPSVTALLLERLRAAIGPQRGAGGGISAGVALCCPTRERFERALDEITPRPGSSERLAAVPVETERRRSPV